MKKLYLISYYFAPLGRADGVNRTYLVKELSDLGWTVEVLSCANPHSLFSNFQKDESLLDILPQDVKLHRLKTFWYGPLGGILKIFRLFPCPFFNWYLTSRRKAMEILGAEGVVMAVLPPLSNGLLAGYLATRRDRSLALYFVDDFKDPQIDLIRKAKTVFAATEQIRNSLASHYGLQEEKIPVIRVGYAEELDRASRRMRAGDKEKLKIVYAGSINSNTGATIIPRAVRHLRRRVGDPSDRLQIDVYAPLNGPYALYTRHFLKDSCVSYQGYLPFKVLMERLPSYDLALVTVTGNISFASKVYHYINAELPLLAVCGDVELKHFIERKKLGLCSKTDDHESLAKNLEYILGNREAIAEYKRNVRIVKPNYSLRDQARRLSELLEKLL
jgi:glycosyltransferase involved in cell wall biosynthesis